MFHGGMGRVEELLSVTRGDIEESLHRGALVLVHGEDEVLVRGDGDWVVYYRSTSKPLQTLVAVTSGAADALGFTEEELAIAAGSHNAEARQLEVVRSILAKGGIGEHLLGCGGHYSIDPGLAHRQRVATEEPPRLWSNCSGKHAMMLATARHLGLPLESYLDPAHPIQATIRDHIALLAGIDPREVVVGVDGCAAPAFALPLNAMARSLLRFGQPEGLPRALADACRRVARAMDTYPDMVGGQGRYDTDLMRSTSEVLLAKAGAEGVHGWVAPDRNLAMAVKVEDGQDRGYRLIVVDLLEALGFYGADEARALRERQCDPVIRNRVGDEVGRLISHLGDTSALRTFR